MKPFKLIGDPHLGRDFKTGVPLHRRGEREAMQLEQFRKELDEDVRLNIMVGDLFDKPFVDLRVVHQVADAYDEASERHPNTTFILMAGNHDIPRQVLLKGSFHALARMIGHLPNVMVLFKPAIVEDVVCFPWEWTVSALDQVENLSGNLPATAIGHWDLLDFGGSVEHLAPVSALQERGVKRLFSGHIHTAGDYTIDGGVVTCTGSMQPYSHSEDPDGNLYRTLTLDEFECMDPDELRNVNVRMVLKPGEALPDLDCLSLVPKREGETETIDLNEVGIENFDLSLVLEQHFEELGVPQKVRLFVREKIGAID